MVMLVLYLQCLLLALYTTSYRQHCIASLQNRWGASLQNAASSRCSSLPAVSSSSAGHRFLSSSPHPGLCHRTSQLGGGDDCGITVA